jgi:divalent metal cation (Fe/Co/Zn/Cd) transporter
VGVVLSILSLVFMPVLAYAKQRTGQQMGSRALVADAKETWVCSYLSLMLLIGVGAFALFGWWWADPVGAARHAPRDRLAGLGDAGGNPRSRPRWGAS